MCKFVNHISLYLQFLNLQPEIVPCSTLSSDRPRSQQTKATIGYSPKQTTLPPSPPPATHSPVHAQSPPRKCRSPSVKLVHLSDDVLLQIISHLLQPVFVNGKRRIGFQSIRNVMPLASCSTRLFKLFKKFLTDVDLSNLSSSTRTVDAPQNQHQLRFACHVANKNLQRLYLRNSCHLSRDFGLIPSHCTALRTLDLSFNSSVDDQLLHAISTNIKTLNNVLIRKCRRVTDAGVVSLANNCAQLACLDVGAVSMLTDEAVIHLSRMRKDTLRILILSFCPRLTNACMPFLSQLQLTALFLRSTCVSDIGVQCLVKDSVIANSLNTVDLIDCAHVTDVSFRLLWTHCASIRGQLREKGGVRRGAMRNAVSLLDGYIRIVSVTDDASNCRMTYVVVCDAGSVNAVERTTALAGHLSLDPELVRILCCNTGARVSSDVRVMLKEQFGCAV